MFTQSFTVKIAYFSDAFNNKVFQAIVHNNWSQSIRKFNGALANQPNLAIFLR